jgi:hypothetical protein
MASENHLPDPYDAVLADLRAKRDRIDNTIRLLEELRSGTAVSGAMLQPVATESATPIQETAGMFLGMSIVDASKKLLALRKRTMGNVEIAKELQAGGLVLTSAEPPNVIGSVLTRRFQQVGDVVKVGRGIWGLKEWYPGRNFKAKSGGAAPGDTVAVAQPLPNGSNDAPPPEPEQDELGRLMG